MKKFIFIMPLIAISLLASCGGSKPEPKLNRWYTYEDWWNYCSNGDVNSEATIEDVGKEVDVTIFDKVHKIRLIDVNHVNAEGEEPEAHCTFEFAELLKDKNNEYITSIWDISHISSHASSNCCFPESVLNKFLNGTEGDISGTVLEMLPLGLQSAIKVVKKKAAVSTNKDANFTLAEYYPKLFPLAYEEIGPSGQEGVLEGEGLIYKYYKGHEDDESYRSKNSGSSDLCYWMRSPVNGMYNSSWCVWDRSGLLTSYLAQVYEEAIAPAFCI